ncbi:MAG: M24 family metallopeptidase [Holosporales bacterium]|jgi:Xaa-Pro aminopeptidase|nr:M24 family metallopeptidase [Holosporales bacterium]
MRTSAILAPEATDKNPSPVDNLANLRVKLSEIESDFILLSMQNAFGNFIDGPSDIEFISGFSGSNGKAVISKEKAVLLVDGRYVKQAKEQTDNSIWEIKQFPDFDANTIISEFSSSGKSLAVIAQSISYGSYVSILELIRRLGLSIKLIEPDFLRTRQNSRTTIFLHDSEQIGESQSERICKIQAELDSDERLLLADQSMIGWLFGVRLSSATESKSVLPCCVALISKSGKPVLFCDLDVANMLPDFDIKKLDEFEDAMASLSCKDVVICDYSTIPAYFVLYLHTRDFNTRDSRNKYREFFCIKNDTEIRNQRIAAESTSLAFIKTLAFTENESGLTEIDICNFFESTAKKLPGFVDLSFNAISAFGKNTSIVHYNPKNCGNSEIRGRGLFLFDAGIHFNNSTTDMTRTVFIGEIGESDEFDQRLKGIYTVILKSVIMFSVAKFPKKVKACIIDSIARYEIWKSGNDYQFGTGHGVGSYGNVHEPPRISQTSTSVMKSGIVVTVEPGIYEQDFGIRLENMLLTKCSESDQFLEFETLNYIPFCWKLIDHSMLSEFEKIWLASYHKAIFDKFSSQFEDDAVTLKWLEINTVDRDSV